MREDSRETDGQQAAGEAARDSAGSSVWQARVNGLTFLSLLLALPVYAMVRGVAIAAQNTGAFAISDGIFLYWSFCLCYTLGGALGKARRRSKWLLRLPVAALAMAGVAGVVSLFGSIDDFPRALIVGYSIAILLHPAAVEWGLHLNAGPAGGRAGLRADGVR